MVPIFACLVTCMKLGELIMVVMVNCVIIGCGLCKLQNPNLVVHNGLRYSIGLYWSANTGL